MKRNLLLFLLLMLVGVALAQEIAVPNVVVERFTVSGVVTSAEDGLPLPQLAVRIKGTNTGVVTNMDGKYSINVEDVAAVLIFEYVGMQTQEIVVGAGHGQVELNVEMQPALEEIDQVMVLGYTSRGKNQMTGSSVQMDAKDLNARPALQVVEGMAGKVPGMVTNMSSSTPGSLSTVRVRGASSVTGSNTDPLYVIDGVPIAYEKENRGLNSSSLSALASLNNADIESVTLLKDASATAAYGARGSNGVIVIKTKNGRKGATKFNFTARYGAAQRLPNLGFMTAEQQLELLAFTKRNGAFVKKLLDEQKIDKGIYLNYAIGKLTPKQLDKVNELWNSLPDVETYRKDILSNADGTTPNIKAWNDAGRPDYDFAKAYWRPITSTVDAQISASGGDDTQTFYASFGGNYSQNPVVGADFKRVSGALNVDRTLVQWLKFSTNNQVSYTRQDGVFAEQIGTMGNPVAGPYYASPFTPVYKNGKPNIDLGGALNWLYLKDHNEGKQVLSHLSTNNQLTATIIEGLSFKSRVALDFVLFDAKEYDNRLHSDHSYEGGRAYQSKQSTYNFVTQNSLNYDLRFLENHKISLLALQEYQRSYVNFLSGQAFNSATDKMKELGSLKTNQGANGSESSWGNAAYLLLANYDYDGRYILDLSYRLEGSSRFARDKRFGNFGSVGVAWNIHAEKFFEPLVNTITRLRFRTSYGISGNSEVGGEGRYLRTLEYFGSYNGRPAGDVYDYGNPDLTWEKNATLDVGVEFSLWYDRISGSVTYFNKRTYDLLQPVPLPLSSGHTSVYRNAGEMYNRGIETQLDFGILRLKDLNVNLGVNLATVNNKVTRLAHDPQSGKTIPLSNGAYTNIDEDHTVNEWYLYAYAGVDPTTGMSLYYTDETRTSTTKDYTQAQRLWMGCSAIPTLTSGLSFHVDWKGAYLDISGYLAMGHKIMNPYFSDFYNDDASHILKHRGVDGMYGKLWKGIGDTEADLPITGIGAGQNGVIRNSDHFLRKGDFFRLRDLTLGYNLPKSWLNRIHFNGSVTVYGQLTNLFTYKFDKKLNYDPEVPDNGLWEFRNPAMRTYSVGCNINF